jgi:hypothetical protein
MYSLVWRKVRSLPKTVMRKSLCTVPLQFAHLVQHSLLVPGLSLCSNCYIKIKENSEETDYPKNDPTSLSTELEMASFSEVGA